MEYSPIYLSIEQSLANSFQYIGPCVSFPQFGTASSQVKVELFLKERFKSKQTETYQQIQSLFSLEAPIVEKSLWQLLVQKCHPP